MIDKPDVHKKNCWEIMNCDHGPGSQIECQAVKHEVSDGYLDGDNGGRACFYIRGTLCEDDDVQSIADKLISNCLNCDVYTQIMFEEGMDSNIFYYLKFIHDRSTKLDDLETLISINTELFTRKDKEQI